MENKHVTVTEKEMQFCPYGVSGMLVFSYQLSGIHREIWKAGLFFREGVLRAEFSRFGPWS